MPARADPKIHPARRGRDPVDGRVRRGARNRERIVEALVLLIRQGNPLPTAEAVARAAGVGERTVFRHFQDMESLHAAVSRRVLDELQPLLAAAPVRGDRESRARGLVDRRVRLFERIAPFRRSAGLLRHRSPFLQAEKLEADRALRAELTRVFAPELGQAAGERLEALDAWLAFETWDRLRHHQRLSRQRARRMLLVGALALLRDRPFGGHIA